MSHLSSISILLSRANTQGIQVLLLYTPFIRYIARQQTQGYNLMHHAPLASSDSLLIVVHYTSRTSKNLSRSRKSNQREQERSHDIQLVNAIRPREICKEGKRTIAKGMCCGIDREGITQSQPKLIFAFADRSNCNGGWCDC